MAVTPRLRDHNFFPHPRSQVAVWRQAIQPDMSSHRHDFVEIVFIVSGTGGHVTGEVRHDLAVGDVMVISNRRSHGYENTRGLSLINIMVREDAIREAERELGMLPGYHALFTLEPVRWRGKAFTSRLKLNAADLRLAVTWVDALEKEVLHGAEGGSFLAKNWLMLLIGLLARRYNEHDSSQADMRLGRLMSLIDQEPARAFTLEEMARQAVMSQRSLLRHFREATGFSPADYVIRSRIRKAAGLLAHGDRAMTITDIAFECGFNDSNYFTRQFHRVMGATPRNYRNG